MTRSRPVARRSWLVLALAASFIITGREWAAAGQAGECADDAYAALDFWLGDWDVFQEDTLVGTNRIEKTLGGCAVLEHWRSAAGGEGESLFYFNPATRLWKQVWVTTRPAAPGGVKEKTMLASPGAPGVRFQGEVPLADGRSYLDRTTLIPLPDGRVRQHIEISRDGGGTWETTFDAIYIPVARRR